MSIKIGDLFEANNTTSSLAHCVSRDLRMGQGIAILFRQKIGRMDELEKANAKVGDIIVLKKARQFIYYLVTKEKYNDKPTYGTLRQTLLKMRDHAVKNEVGEICMPKIGCGRDNLNWEVVQQMIRTSFFHSDVKITVYQLGKTKFS